MCKLISGLDNYHDQALDLRLAINDHWGEATSLVNLGLVYWGLGQYELARQHCERALDIQREIGDPRGEAYSLTYLGHALSALEKWEAAVEAYRQAKNLREDLGQSGLAIDDVAGLARVALARGKADQAVSLVRDIQRRLDEHGSDGIEYPLQVYLTMYHGIETAADHSPTNGQAEQILARAFAELQDRAKEIKDASLRQKFLKNVPVNREIMELWQAKN